MIITLAKRGKTESGLLSSRSKHQGARSSKNLAPFFMSLRFFFNRRGGIVLSLVWIGWVSTAAHLSPLYFAPHERGAVTKGLYTFFAILLFIRSFFRFFPWYDREHRGHGIEEQFEKAMVPTAYVTVVTNLVFWLWDRAWPFLVFTSLLMMIVVFVDFIMLYFHLKDHEKQPPGYFARVLYEPHRPNGITN